MRPHKITQDFLITTYDWGYLRRIHASCKTNSEFMQASGLNRSRYLAAIKFGLIPRICTQYHHSKDTRLLISKRRKQFLRDNPSKHPWRNKNKFVSAPCEKFKQLLMERGIHFCAEYSPLLEYNRYFSIDVAFPDKKLGIEINGNQHYMQDGKLTTYHQARHDTIESHGWRILEIHYSLVYNKVKVNVVIDSIIRDNGLPLNDGADYRSYLKQKTRKQAEIAEYVTNRKTTQENELRAKINLVINSEICFDKFGWVGKLAPMLGMCSSNVHKWMKREMPEFYEIRCFKRKQRK